MTRGFMERTYRRPAAAATNGLTDSTVGREPAPYLGLMGVQGGLARRFEAQHEDRLGVRRAMKPMLASPVELVELKFPELASPKLDGIRAIVWEGQLLSRKLEKIPNEHIQAVVKSWGPSANGLDRELIIGKVTDPKVFNTTQSGVMRISGKPSFSYHVFDIVDEETPFLQRLANLKARLELLRRPEIVLVPQVLIGGQAELKKIEAEILRAWL